jgi:uncharacterized protein (DUF2336 family)
MNEFRELERPQAMRKKDVVLMATVTSFEGLPHPSRSELRQFAELFAPLFNASSEEARRQAVAALSQSRNVPPAAAFFIASQPIAVAAPFLISSPCLSNEALITIARSQGIDHAHAIARRESLSPIVVDALVGLRYDQNARRADSTDKQAAAEPPAVEVAAPSAGETERQSREDQLRRRIKLLAGHVERAENDRLGLRNISTIQAALLVRFARSREAGLFAGVLADALSASRWLSERIMLDISGQQLATTLKGLGLETSDALFVLTRFYGHLEEAGAGESRAETLWASLDTEDCGERVEAWRRADGYTYGQSQRQAAPQATLQASRQDSGMREETSRPLRTSATVRKSVAGQRSR